MKEMNLKFKYMSSEIVAITCSVLALLLMIFGLNRTNLPSWLTVIIPLILFGIIILVVAVYLWNFSRLICIQKVKGKIIDQVSFYIGYERGIFTSDTFSDLRLIEYEYKGKIRRRRILVSEIMSKKIGSKIPVYVCPIFPRIIYVPRNN